MQVYVTPTHTLGHVLQVFCACTGKLGPASTLWTHWPEEAEDLPEKLSKRDAEAWHSLIGQGLDDVTPDI